MGSKKGEGGHYLPDNPSVTAFAVTAPFTQGSLCPLRRGRGRTGSSAPTFKVDGAAGRNGEEFMQTLQMVLYFRALKC